MGFSKPSKIQERALPLMLSNPCVMLFSSSVVYIMLA
jgi:superfamily II DNA/RNA helicase